MNKSNDNKTVGQVYVFFFLLSFSTFSALTLLHYRFLPIFTKVHTSYIPTKWSEDFLLTYTSLYSILLFVFVEFLVVVDFVLLKHRLHRVKNFIVVMNLVVTSLWIRIGQWIHVYDIKSCFAHGCHRVGVEEGNALKGDNTKMFYWGCNRCANPWSWSLTLSLSQLFGKRFTLKRL